MNDSVVLETARTVLVYGMSMLNKFILCGYNTARQNVYLLTFIVRSVTALIINKANHYNPHPAVKITMPQVWV